MLGDTQCAAALLLASPRLGDEIWFDCGTYQVPEKSATTKEDRDFVIPENALYALYPLYYYYCTVWEISADEAHIDIDDCQQESPRH